MSRAPRNVFDRITAWLTTPAGYFWMILLLGVLVRVWRFGDVPYGMYQDEASLAYDSWSLLHYGVERNGFFLPIVLGAYGCGMSGTLAAYLMMPFIAVLGLTPVAARLLNLTLGIAALPLLWMLAKKIWDEPTALLAMFLLAISPWHIMISRWGLDCNLFPPLFLIAVLLLAYAPKRPWLLVASSAVLGLCLYSYAASYVVVPVFILLAALWLRRNAREITHTHIAWSAAILAVLALPAVLYVVINQLHLPSIRTPFFTIPLLPTVPRYAAATLVGSSHWLDSITSNLRSMLHLFVRQSDGWATNVIDPYGTLYAPTMVVAAVGMVLAWVQARKKGILRQPVALVYAWLAAALCLGVVMGLIIHRFNIVYLPIILFAAYALSWLRRYPRVFPIVICCYLLMFFAFTWSYFGAYAARIPVTFMGGMQDAIRYAADRSPGNVCVTITQSSIPEMQVLMALEIDPRVFERTVVYKNPRALYRTALSFDRFRFGIETCDPGKTQAYVFRMQDTKLLPPGLDITRFGTYFVGLKR